MSRWSTRGALGSIVASVMVAFAVPAVAETPREVATAELTQAFQACEMGMQADAITARVEQLDAYRAHRARAQRADASLLRSKGKAGEYVVREWLTRCDGQFVRSVQEGRKAAAATEADAALEQCKAATAAESVEEAQAVYDAFRDKRRAAMKLDPRVGARRKGAQTMGAQLAACDRRVAVWLAKQKKRGAAEAGGAVDVVAAAQREQDDALSGSGSHAMVAAAAGH